MLLDCSVPCDGLTFWRNLTLASLHPTGGHKEKGHNTNQVLYWTGTPEGYKRPSYHLLWLFGSFPFTLSLPFGHVDHANVPAGDVPMDDGNGRLDDGDRGGEDS